MLLDRQLGQSSFGCRIRSSDSGVSVEQRGCNEITLLPDRVRGRSARLGGSSARAVARLRSARRRRQWPIDSDWRGDRCRGWLQSRSLESGERQKCFADILCTRAAEHVLAGSIKPDSAAVQDDEPVRDFGLLDKVRGPQDTQSPLGPQVEDIPHDVEPCGRIEPNRLLVHEQDARPVQKRPGEFDPAAVASAQSADPIVRPVGEMEALQRLRDPGLRSGPVQSLKIGMEAQVLRNGYFEIKRLLLENHADPAEGSHGIALQVVTDGADRAAIGCKKPG